jgi:hypothetical protein
LIFNRGSKLIACSAGWSASAIPGTLDRTPDTARSVRCATPLENIDAPGPAVVLLHGYGKTGDMWVALADDLARDHTENLKNPLLWHFRFGGPDMERLVAGRERTGAVNRRGRWRAESFTRTGASN